MAPLGQQYGHIPVTVQGRSRGLWIHCFGRLNAMVNFPGEYPNENSAPSTVHGVVFADRAGTDQASMRFRPSSLNRCSLARTAATRIFAPIAGASVPGMRTMTSPGGNSPGVAAMRCSSGAREP